MIIDLLLWHSGIAHGPSSILVFEPCGILFGGAYVLSCELMTFVNVIF